MSRVWVRVSVKIKVSLENWKIPPGRPHITWLNTIQRDLRAHNLTLNETVDLAQNRPLWRLMRMVLRTSSGACQKRIRYGGDRTSRRGVNGVICRVPDV